MFNTKQINELKEELNKSIEDLKNNTNAKLDENSNTIKEIYSSISELKEDNAESAEKIRSELEEINTLKAEFETALRRLGSTSRNIEDNIAAEVKEIAEKEIEAIKTSSKRFKNVEEELANLLARINNLQLELSKFVSISQQIKLVDFTLEKHYEDMNKSEKERIQLINENERLKSLMARMKRSRS